MNLSRETFFNWIKFGWDKFGESTVIHQIRQRFPPYGSLGISELATIADDDSDKDNGPLECGCLSFIIL